MAAPNYEKNVFINFPFDEQYRQLFHAMYFAIADCGFRVRCALEVEDGSLVRFEKILRIIRESKYGIHDVSRTELDAVHGLPRFNMPLELGLFLAAKHFGSGQQKSKSCLILDYERSRYHKFISDISGQDIEWHSNDPQRLMTVVRNWLRSLTHQKSIPGGISINRRYLQFDQELPSLCDKLKIEPDELTYADYATVVSNWLTENK